MENITLKHILSRRSIRKYLDKKIPEDTMRDLLRAAMNAPSASNQQIWHFIVIDDRRLLSELSGIHGGYLTLLTAPSAVLVCGEPNTATLECYWQHDCAAATENILIAAESLGIGAVWQGVNPSVKNDTDEIIRILNLPKGIKPFSIIALGYPDETFEARDNYKEGKIHYNNVW